MLCFVTHTKDTHKHIVAGMMEKLKYAQTVADSNTLADIWNGCKVAELRQCRWFASGDDFGLVMGTDGGVLFKCTGIQAWSIWGFIANLSPQERLSKCLLNKNVLINSQV